MMLQWLVSAGLLLSCVATNDPLAASSDGGEGQIPPNEDASLEMPAADSPLGAHQVFLSVQDMAAQKPSPRHENEKAELLRRMSRAAGKWDSSHPRHRLLDALHGFSKYFDRNIDDVKRWRKLYKGVTRQQKKILEHTVQYSSKFKKVEHLLAENHQLCQRIVDAALEYYEIPRSELDEHVKKAEKDKKVAEKVSVSQALKHIVRDWSDEGVGERGDAFPCLLKTLDALFPERDNAKPVKLLLPGAGLGRLGHELSGLGGFEVTSNEWSMYMNIVYRFLEQQTPPASTTVHPFVDYWSHHISNADMLRPVSFPDTPLNTTSSLLVEGDFTTAFNDKTASFDAVVTHFFIDTARNLMSYLETIHKLLPPGGHWVNFGPLLYGTGPFVQLSLEEILAVAEAMGFEFLETDGGCGELTVEGGKVRGLEAVYGFNDRALTKNAYQAQFWVARKKA